MGNKITSAKRLLAIINILDDYKEFCKNLTNYSDNRHGEKIDELIRISKGLYSDSSIAKRFYKDNKKTIDTICKYADLNDFIYRFDSDYFYNYIINNKSNINTILKLVTKINELGFNSILFNENYDFTKEEYKYYKNYSYDFLATYLDNMEAIIKYDDDFISYKTSDSNYKIVFEVKNDKFTQDYKSIFVNSLLFDAKRLPNKYNIEEIINKILGLEKINENKFLTIRSSIDLNVIANDFQDQIDDAKNKLEKYAKKLSSKELEEYLSILNMMKEQSIKLNQLSKLYNNNLNDEVSLKLLEKEKTLYLKNRNHSLFNSPQYIFYHIFNYFATVYVYLVDLNL